LRVVYGNMYHNIKEAVHLIFLSNSNIMMVFIMFKGTCFATNQTVMIEDM
jgi:hypothetical protein